MQALEGAVEAGGRDQPLTVDTRRRHSTAVALPRSCPNS
jgi:hypothetical protein